MLTKEEVKEIVDTALKDHEVREKASQEASLKELLNSLVPGGDAAPHREYHQMKINAAKAAKETEEAKKKLYEALFRLVAEKSLDGLARVIRGLFWIAVIAGLAKLGVVLPAWATEFLK